MHKAPERTGTNPKQHFQLIKLASEAVLNPYTHNSRARRRWLHLGSSHRGALRAVAKGMHIEGFCAVVAGARVL